MAVDLQKTYQYQIFRNNVFLGLLPNVVSAFEYTQAINTAGTSISIVVGDTVDVSQETPVNIETEEGIPLQTEAGENVTIERSPDIVGNTNEVALLRNNNDIKVYEISANNPNGKLVFAGYISRWLASYGKDNATITAVSYGTELDNYISLPAETTDVVQALYDLDNVFFSYPGASSTWRMYYQSYTVSAGVTNLSSVLLSINATNSYGVGEQVVLEVFADEATAQSGGGTSLGYAFRTITSTSYIDYKFTFSTPITVVPGATYYLRIRSNSLVGPATFNLKAKFSNPYAGGYGALITSGSTPGIGTYDFYFTTYTATLSAAVTFTSQDPTTILKSIIDAYVAAGGIINYSASSTDLTGSALSIQFKVNTVLESIRMLKDAAPYNWYWYVDPATNILYFKQAGTVADHTMILGQHILSLDVEATTEDITSDVYFTGGPNAGVNTFVRVQNTAVQVANNGRKGLAKISNNRVTDTTTAQTIANAYINQYSSEQYQTTIEVSDDAYDTTLFSLGQIVAFGSFGNFVDNLLLQIVQIDKYEHKVVLGLGVPPKRQSAVIESIQRSLSDLQTIANPATPS